MNFYNYHTNLNPMGFYEAVTVQPVSALCYDAHQYTDVPLDFSELCALAEAEDMKPLTVADIHDNPLGVAAVGTYSGPRYAEKHEVLSHAAITGFNQNEAGGRIARIGSVVTVPNVRGYGIGTMTVDALMELAESETDDLFGFDAICNPASQGLFARLGFTATGSSGLKAVMTKQLHKSIAV